MKPEMSHVKKVKAGASRGKEEIPKKRGRGRPVGSKNIKWVSGFPAYSRFPFCVKERTQGGESSSCRIDRPLQNGIKRQSASGEVIVCIKRGRGRPRKIETEMKREEVQKRRRGRPRKILTVPKDEHPKIVLGNKNVGFRPKMRKQNYYDSECEASTSNAGSHQVTHDIHPPGVSFQRGWTRESAMMSDELLPPGREPLGPQYPGWETAPSQVNWVPGGIVDPPAASTVTHWFVEEPHVPRATQYPEGPSLDQHEFREDLLQGLADFRYQITRELAAARGEMREGAELVRSAIDGVASEIHRLGLLLQPLITVLNSGSVLYPTQNSPAFNPLLRHQQDTPPEDPPSVSNQANPTGVPQQDAFPIRPMCSPQCDSVSRNTQCPGRPTSTLTISPSPQEEELRSQPQEDPPKDSIPLIECPPATRKLYPRKEKCRGSSTDFPRHDLNSQAQGDPQKHSSMPERPVSIKRVCQRKERCNGSSDDVRQEITSPIKSASTLKQDKSPSQFSSIAEDGKTIMVDYPSDGKLSDSRKKNPALSDEPVKEPLSPLLDYTSSESLDSVTMPLAWSPPLQTGATAAPLLDVSPVGHVDRVSGMSPMPVDSSVPT